MTLEGEKLIALLKHDASIHIIDPETDIDYYGSLELNCIILTLYLQPCISPTLFLSVLHIIHILRLFQSFRGQIRVTNRRE